MDLGRLECFQCIKECFYHNPCSAFARFLPALHVGDRCFQHRCERLLSQGGHPIAFFNKPFSPKLLCASTYVRELFVFTAAVKKWQQYLFGSSFHHYYRPTQSKKANDASGTNFGTSNVPHQTHGVRLFNSIPFRQIEYGRRCFIQTPKPCFKLFVPFISSLLHNFLGT